MLEALLTPRCEDAAGWCEGYLEMPVRVSPNLPGPLSLGRQPWMREILGCFLDPEVKHLSLVMGTQTGKTALLLMGAALLAVFDPQPMIVALPDDELADKWAWHKFLPFFEGNGALRDLLPGPRQMGGGEVEGVQGGLEGGEVLRQDAIRIQPQGEGAAVPGAPAADDGGLGAGVTDAEGGAAPGGAARQIVQEGEQGVEVYGFGVWHGVWHGVGWVSR